ncbi:hypothetical protein HJC23_004121 [Cyclotella cryptica]|uniref:Uncharacterized protein n=1 Tax=Cyclotella cryptica TaxID=29204 RepID=A0ABD3P8M9_9STRA
MGMPLLLFVEAIIIACVLQASAGFLSTSTKQTKAHSQFRTNYGIKKSSIERNGRHKAFMSIFDDVAKFFSGLNNNDDDVPPNQSKFEVSDVEDVDGAYTGSKRIITIPEPNSWKAQQFDNAEVNLRYCDLSGSIIIQFADDAITIDRLGSAPSMKYLLHESIVLNGFLDELNAIVFEGDVVEENRLLTLPDPGDAIEKARGVLSFS